MYEIPFHSKSLETTTFLVTGGAGFIGSHLVEYLIKYKALKIKILDNFSTGYRENVAPFLKENNVEMIENDITDANVCIEACQNIDYVFHQAALGSVPRSIKYPLATHNANVTGFINILNASKETKVKRVVYASSSSVYGDSPTLPKQETHKGNLLSPYALTKAMNESYADIFARTYGLESIGLRYFNVFGNRQSPEGAYAAVIPLFIKALLNHISPKINGDGNQTRDFTFIENVVQMNIKACFAPFEATNNAYNVACGDQITVNQLFEILKKLAKSDLNALHQPERNGDIRDSLADISKAEQLIGYQPTVLVQEGLQKTFEWFKKEQMKSKQN
jgi:UDP-N-acetylglucosamine/UDP-N-acetylgalactosamine 4-epimerase